MSSYDLVALNPVQLQESHVKLRAWAEAGMQDASARATEAKEAYLKAEENNWSASYLKTCWRREKERRKFFEKVDAALEAGYYLIPPFMVEAFAVRVDTEEYAAPEIENRSTYQWPVRPTVAAKRLPIRVGEYVGSTLPVYRWQAKEEGRDGKEMTVWKNRTTGEWGEPVFPATMAKPAVMDETARAMALKVFDEIGLVQQAKDPIIAGIIKHPKRGKDLTFFIAWDFDPRGF